MKQLSPDEALQVLENAVRQIQTNYDTHAVFQQAVQVLKLKLVEKNSKKDEK